jgi:hypothetical protein
VNEKPVKLDMSFGEALARLSKVHRVSTTTKPIKKHKKAGKSEDKPAKNPGQTG